MQTKRRHEGYFLVDHRNSPGLSPELLASIGADPRAGKGLFESATITCAHCGVVVVINPERSRARGHCRSCDHYVCDQLACHMDCRPLKKLIDTTRNAALLGKV